MNITIGSIWRGINAFAIIMYNIFSSAFSFGLCDLVKNKIHCGARNKGAIFSILLSVRKNSAFFFHLPQFVIIFCGNFVFFFIFSNWTIVAFQSIEIHLVKLDWKSLGYFVSWIIFYLLWHTIALICHHNRAQISKPSTAIHRFPNWVRPLQW